MAFDLGSRRAVHVLALVLMTAAVSSTGCLAVRRNLGWEHATVTTAPRPDPLHDETLPSPLGSTSTHATATARSQDGIEVHVSVLVEYSLAPTVDARLAGLLRQEHREAVAEPAFRADLERSIVGAPASQWHAGREQLDTHLERSLASVAADRGLVIHDVVVESVWCGSVLVFALPAPIGPRETAG